jgi:DNA repair protein RecN (Recombination protein N)
MKELAASHQVFCITHLPQVAASAESQFIVAKETDGTRTRTLLNGTTPAGRITEIARMLGGPAETAKKHARTLLGAK